MSPEHHHDPGLDRGQLGTTKIVRFLRSGPKILLVEDNLVNQQVALGLLERWGCEVRLAANGLEALGALEEEIPDLILMDVVMPGMNGFQATRKLNQDPRTSSIPVIIITSKDQETDKIWGMRQGAVEYLVKPVDAKQLVAKINAVMAG